MTSRRSFLLATLLAPACAGIVREPRFSSYPFTLGVASGYPTTDGIALWTRLAPIPLEGGGMPPEPVAVRWQVAEDEAFRRIVRSGGAVAVPENAHSVHVEVDGLAAGRDYFYRFLAGGEASPVGRTRTAPERGKGDERMRIAVGSCQQYEQGFYVAHRHLAAESVDLVVFLGDYIYESTWGREHVRAHHKPEPQSLADYRDRHALYKGDADLQKSHASAPWIVTWDDHEVDNDYANDRPEDLLPDFLARRAAAYKAFYEHMPLRRSVLLAGNGMRIYGRLDWGGLAAFHVLDDRQYRSHQVCPKPMRGGSNLVGPACTERLDPALTMLGAAQEQWLDESLGAARASWNLIVQQTLFVPAGRVTPKDGLVHWTDGWDGYPAARQRLLRSIERRRASNPLILGGDLHAAFAAQVHSRPEDPASPVLATELVTTSISSQGFGAQWTQNLMRANPHILYADGATRGYMTLELNRSHAEARQRGVTTVKKPEAGISTVKSFTVESGRAGVA